MATFSKDNLVMARKLSEDDKFLTLEICKDENYELNIADGDQFYTMLFIRQDGEGGTIVWKPWEPDIELPV